MLCSTQWHFNKQISVGTYQDSGSIKKRTMTKTKLIELYIKEITSQLPPFLFIYWDASCYFEFGDMDFGYYQEDDKLFNLF